MAHTLLLADDSVTIQRVVELTFAGEDIRIVAVGNGQQAIERLSDDPPDIVLADIGMPLVDGYAVASFVKNHEALRSVPVLLMVGAFDPVDEDRVQASGASGVLVKPFEPTLVISRVRELLGLGGRSEAAVLQLSSVEAPAAEPTNGAAPAAPPGDTDRKPADKAEPAPGVERLWAEVAGAESTSPSMPAVTFASAPAAGSVADAFAALLAAEQGEPAPAWPVPDAVTIDPLQLETIVEQVTSRVVEHLGTRTVRDRVDRIVLEVAERLVREEVARIRASAAARRD